MRLRFYIFLFLSFFVSSLAIADSTDPNINNSNMGKTELVTCVEGIAGQTKLYAGIRIKPHPGWHIQDFNVTWGSSDSFVGRSFIPLYPEEDAAFIYPAIFKLKQNTQEITLSASGTVLACQDQQCLDIPFTLQKTLPPSFATHSPKCIQILHALARTPQPVSDTIRGAAIPENNIFKIVLYMPHNVKKLELFTMDRQPLAAQNLQIHENKLSFDLKQIDGENLSFIAQTQEGIYEVEIPVLPPGSNEPPRSISFWEWVKLLWLYLFISPLFMVWGCHWQKTIGDFKIFCRYLQFSIGLVALVGIGLAWYPQVWQLVPFGKIACCVLMLATFMWGGFSPFLCTLALLFMPKPMGEILQQCSAVDRIIFVTLQAVCWAALFQLQFVRAKPIYDFFKKWRKQSPYGIRFSFSLFWLLLLIYTIVYL